MNLFNSLQEAFDATIDHLAKQKQRAMVTDTYTNRQVCAYSGLDGRRCAIGAHIPQGHDAEGLNGGVRRLFQRYPDIAQLLSIPSYQNDLNFWVMLQRCHDRSPTVEELHQALGAVAIQHNLNQDKIAEITEWK